MLLMQPGYYPDTYFPDRFWTEDYWAEYGYPGVLRGVASSSDPRTATLSTSETGSQPNITSHRGTPTITDQSNNEVTIQ